jgi:hypothetical protein
MMATIDGTPSNEAAQCLQAVLAAMEQEIEAAG